MEGYSWATDDGDRHGLGSRVWACSAEFTGSAQVIPHPTIVANASIRAASPMSGNPEARGVSVGDRIGTVKQGMENKAEALAPAAISGSMVP